MVPLTLARVAAWFQVVCQLAISLINRVVPQHYTSFLPWSWDLGPATRGFAHEVDILSTVTFNWTKIDASETLEYHPCYHGEFQCARLELPLDHRQNASSSQTVAIAVIRLPAKVPITDARYGGAIIVSGISIAGGPGGSGVLKVLSHGMQIQTIVDAPSPPSPADSDGDAEALDKYFDIIGFDPRGIGYSTPRLRCFPDAETRENWVLQSKTEGIVGSSDVAFDSKWSRWLSLSESCMDRVSEEGNNSIAYHMNTRPLVADMAALVERHGEWREARAHQALSNNVTSGVNEDTKGGKHGTLPHSLRWNRGQETLQYWGFSYGALVGQTFASTYPERVSRLVLDAVLLSAEYYHGSWVRGLTGSDAVWDTFFEYCSESGPEKCPFYIPGGTEAIKIRYHLLLSSLRVNPVAVPASGLRGPDVITESDVMFEVKESLYCPIQKFPQLAKELAELDQGDGSLLARIKQSRLDHFHPPSNCRDDGPFSAACQEPGGWQDEDPPAVYCADAENISGMTKEAYKQYAEELMNRSTVAGPSFSETRMPCVGWEIRPKWEHTEPSEEVTTSHPILFIGNRLDPSTPLCDAFAAARNFAGSVVLQQDSVGHMSSSSPSLCTAKAIRQYFQTGQLPGPGLICQPDEYPFVGKPDVSPSSLDEGDAALLEALRDLAQRCRG
ncbi:TAP-like protein-domain-containing protein [Podospora aff. communis PSN243]|uniref:TAP-like protein-domain-containing protein n=1 Tax=Podospora aff. communis PSN243 TaxID=3040156 RepID=A0AAV9GDU1_9PEZI|nr:TAP-like protein-domain-containing protein [Podospora aff. communis PSN243]